MKRGIVVAGGTVDSGMKDILENREGGTIVIGVDRGISVFIRIGLQADYYLGDLDSIDSADIPLIPKDRLHKFPAEKNASDLELALALCVELDLDEVFVYGATGTRWDHSFSNLLMLKRFYDLGLQVILANEKNQARVLSSHQTIRKEEVESYRYLSILPLSMGGVLVSETGVKYPLDQERLLFGQTRGVSNESIGEDIKIEVMEGVALLILSND
ncbi:thiamine diphosphokinase [Gottschalkiaceae bacterium SANA]|nr:thiamine diphosphokinase [Gottschalkiaceae bacterium SANA]